MKRLYDSVHWRKARKAYLAQHPLCVMCAEAGHDTPATVVDHIEPHNEDYQKFWDSENWQPLCSQCHNSIKSLQDSTGQIIGCDVNGFPLDKNHFWGGDGD